MIANVSADATNLPIADISGAMSGSDADTEPDERDGTRQFRLLGAGFVAAGAVVVGLSNAADPRGLLVALLGFLGVMALVLERTQGVEPGVSFGFLTGGISVWLWPSIRVGTAGYDYLGALVVGVGLVNVLLAPVGYRLRRFGERLAGGSGSGGENGN